MFGSKHPIYQVSCSIFGGSFLSVLMSIHFQEYEVLYYSNLAQNYIFKALKTYHVWFLSWPALRASLATVTGLVEELIFPTAGVLGTGKHAAHLR